MQTDNELFLSKIPRMEADGGLRYSGIILEGSPGIGKTAFASSIFPDMPRKHLVRIPMANRTKEEFGTFAYPMVEENQVAVLDDNGDPVIEDGVIKTRTEKSVRVHPALSEVSIEPLLEENIGDNFGILLFDDVTLSDPRVQGAILEIVQFGVIANRKLGKNVLTFLTGNTVNDGAYAVEWSSALLGRCVVIKPKPDFKRWLTFKENQDICPSVVSFLAENPRFFCTSDFDETQNELGEEKVETDESGREAAPRDWTRLGTAMYGIGGFSKFQPDFIFTSPLIYASSMIGSVAANAYVQHARTYSVYPSAEALFENPELWNDVPNDKRDFLAGCLSVVFSLRSHAIRLIKENIKDNNFVLDVLNKLLNLTVTISARNNEVMSFLISGLIRWASDKKEYKHVLNSLSKVITQEEFANNKDFRAILSAQWEHNSSKK